MKILLLSRYGPLGASSRVRSYQYLPYLKAHGVDVKVAPLLDDDYVKSLYFGGAKPLFSILGAYLRRVGDILNSRCFDLVWIEKELFPWLPAWGEAILSHLGIPYIVDYDDATFHRYDRHPRGMVRALLGGKIDVVMRRAAIVTVGNDYLANRARRAGARRIEHLPSVVDMRKYSRHRCPCNDVFTIGWIGSPVTECYLQQIAPALSEVCRRNRGRVALVGAQNAQFRNVPVKKRPWLEEGEDRDIQSFDVGIMPLPDEPWERGKCGYKLIQYMACGKPVVASPVGMNRRLVEHGVNGFLASSLQEWVEALSALQDHKYLREDMGKAGRNLVEREYCLQVTAPRLLSILRSALSV